MHVAQPKSVGELLELGDQREFSDAIDEVYSRTVDGVACNGCGGTDGFAISVSGAKPRNPVATPPAALILNLFLHHKGGIVGAIGLDVEDGEQFVNRLTEAIAAARIVKGT